MANFDKEVLDKIYQMYIDEKFGYNEICMQCKKKVDLENGPVPIFHVGEKYRGSEKRIVFIGMVAYGWNSISEIFDHNQIGIDKTQSYIENRIRELYFGEKEYSRYYSFINEVCTEIFGGTQNGFDHIAITNFVHCNTGEVKDTLPQSVRNYCAQYKEGEPAGFIHKELEILDPTHIVVMSTDYKYTRFTDDFASTIKYLEVIHPSAPGRVKEDFKNKIKIFYNE